MPLANFSPFSTTRFSPSGIDMPDHTRVTRVASGVGDVDPAVVTYDKVVAADAFGDHGRIAGCIVCQDLAFAGGDGVKQSVGAKGLAIGSFRLGEEERDLAVERA